MVSAVVNSVTDIVKMVLSVITRMVCVRKVVMLDGQERSVIEVS